MSESAPETQPAQAENKGTEETKPATEPAKDPTDWVSEARKWEKRAKENSDAAARLKEIEDAKKTESQRLTEDRDTHKTRAEAAEAKLMRLEVGLDKGLTPAQAKRLVGNTREELEADAEDLLATFGGAKKDASGVKSRPQPNLRGGNEPDEDPEPDISKIVAQIPRR